MFGGHFYHAIIRKTVAVFGTLFNDINVVRKDSAGNVKDIQKVPLAYGPRQKFLARIDEQPDLTDAKVAIKLPRMSFEITNITYDSTAANSRLNTLTTTSDSNSRTTIDGSVPYIVDMQLNILAKNQDDALQIMEQILPTFRPTYTLSVNYVNNIAPIDVPITLQSVSLLDDYQGDYLSRRVLIYTLDFTMKVRFFGSPSKSSVITTVIANLNDQESQEFLEASVTQAETFGTATPDDFTAVTTIQYIPATTVFEIGLANGSGDFSVGEVVTGVDSGTSARVVSWDSGTSTVTVEYPDGYFFLAETLTNGTASYSVNTYTAV